MKLWKYVLAVLAGIVLGILVLFFWLEYREERAIHGVYGGSTSKQEVMFIRAEGLKPSAITL